LFLNFSKKLKISLIFFLFIYPHNVFAASITQKLWGGLNNEDISVLKKLSTAIKADDYKDALEIAKQSKSTRKSPFNDSIYDIALWNKYSQVDNKKINPRDISFNDISRFVNDNRFFPNLLELKKNVERVAIANKIPYQFSRQYFSNFPATSINSKIYLLESESSQPAESNPSTTSSNQSDLQKNINDLILNIWLEENFSLEEEQKFLADYGNRLTEESHVARINRLLWDNKIMK